MTSEINILKINISKIVNAMFARGDAELIDSLEEVLNNKEKKRWICLKKVINNNYKFSILVLILFYIYYVSFKMANQQFFL